MYEHPVQGRAVVPDPPRSAWRRWTSRLYQGALGAGALAGAIAAVLALRLPHDVEDAAAFNTVMVTVGVPYGEYRQRLEPPRPEPGKAENKGMHPMAQMSVLVTPTPTTPPGSAADEPTESPTTDGDDTVPESSHPAMDPTEPAGPVLTIDPRLLNAQRFQQAAPPRPGDPEPIHPTPTSSTQVTVLRAALVRIGDACQRLGYGPFCDGGMPVATENTRGKSLTEQQMVDRQVAAFKKLRTVRVKGSRKAQPVGVVVTANMELSGLRGKAVLLSWSMWQKDGAERLYGEWLNERLAYRIEATSDHDTASVDYWIPLPKQKGPYFVRTRLAFNGTTLATSDSDSFR
jgi:hypothetical protein